MKTIGQAWKGFHITECQQVFPKEPFQPLYPDDANRSDLQSRLFPSLRKPWHQLGQQVYDTHLLVVSTIFHLAVEHGVDSSQIIKVSYERPYVIHGRLDHGREIELSWHKDFRASHSAVALCTQLRLRKCPFLLGAVCPMGNHVRECAELLASLGYWPRPRMHRHVRAAPVLASSRTSYPVQHLQLNFSVM